MKKIISILALMATLGLCASDVKELTSELKSSDTHVADASRMALQLAPDNSGETALLNSFKAQKNPNLKAGIAYSLGKMQSKKAVKTLLAAAKEDSIVGQAAILALAEFKSPEAIKALNALKKSAKANTTRLVTINIALDIAGDKANTVQSTFAKVPADFASMDENQKVKVISGLTVSAENKKFLIEEVNKESSARILVALAVALQKQGGVDSVEAIFVIKTKANEWPYEFSIVDSIAKTKGAGVDEVIAKKVAEKNMPAMKAAAYRGMTSLEGALLKNTKDTNKYVVMSAFTALEDLGCEKTVNEILVEMEKSNSDYVKAAIKTFAKAITRLDETNKAKFKKMAEQYSQNAKENKNAYAKALTLF